MSDTKVVNAGENTPEEIAYKLFIEVAHAEDVRTRYTGGERKPSRQWILDTYAECILAVRAPADR